MSWTSIFKLSILSRINLKIPNPNPSNNNNIKVFAIARSLRFYTLYKA